MDLILDLLATVSRWSRSNLSEIALALVGCLLVLFGADFKGWVEQRLGSIAGALRVPLMALLCLIGSGAALIYATPWVPSRAGTCPPVRMVAGCPRPTQGAASAPLCFRLFQKLSGSLAHPLTCSD